MDESVTVAVIRSGKALWDPQDHFAAIQRRADAFVWNTAMQKKADAWASEQMVGWIEEAQKGLEGLRSNDEGRMLNARFGLSWGLMNVMRVQLGVLITGENRAYPEVAGSLGEDSHWVRLSRRAFGITDGLALQEQVMAGLQLYLLTTKLLKDAIRPEHATLIEEAVSRIRNQLGQASNKANSADARSRAAD